MPLENILNVPPQASLPQVTVTLHPSGQVETRSNLTPPGAWTAVLNLLLQALVSARQEEQKEIVQANGNAPRIVVPNVQVR